MKEKILYNATEMFLNIGFKSITMDDIASNAGISKKTIYAHFSNKIELVEVVTLNMFDVIKKGVAICDQKLSPIDELFHIKRVVMEHLKDEKSSPLYQLQKHYPAIYASLKQKQFLIMQETIQENLKRGVQSGVFRSSIDVDFISRIYFSGMIGIKDQQIFPLTKYSMNTLTSLYLEYHLRGISTEKGIQELENQLKNKS